MKTKIKTTKISLEKIYYVREIYAGATDNFIVTEHYNVAIQGYKHLKEVHPLNEIWIEEKTIRIKRIDIIEEPF